MEPIKVILVDDHEIVRVGLKTLLRRNPDLNVVGEAGTSEEALRLVAERTPDVVILDVRLPGTGGVECCRQIKAEFPKVKVLMLTSYSDEEALWASITAGADGYLLKEIGSDQLIDAVIKLKEGEQLLSGDTVRRVLKAQGLEGSPVSLEERLTPQEGRILNLIGEGLSNKAIAKELGLGENTVRNYVSNIFDKMHFANRAQAAAYVARKKLIRD